VKHRQYNCKRRSRNHQDRRKPVIGRQQGNAAA
jgi:hypothetical protein